MCQENGKCDLTREQAIGILAAETLKGVSEGFDLHRLSFGTEARSFIEARYTDPATVDGQTMFGALTARDDTEYGRDLVNADTLLSQIGIYELASSQSRWSQGQSATLAVFNEVISEYAEHPDTSRAKAFLDAVMANPTRAKLVFNAFGRSKYVQMIGSPAAPMGLDRLIQDLPENMRAEAALAYAQGLTGKTSLNDEEVQNAILAGKWGATITAGLEEFFEGAGLLGPGMTLMTKPNGQTVIRDAIGREFQSIKKAVAATSKTVGLVIPQGFTGRQFDKLSSTVRGRADELGLGDDIDIAIRVSPERFDEIMNDPAILNRRIVNPNPGSAAERMRQTAIERGRIHAGGLFDNGPQSPLSFGFD